jgi:diguanylate cyclase (GGDEF)-like protein/PAS domain S-box-containing protein
LKDVLHRLLKNDDHIFELIEEGFTDGMWIFDLDQPSEEWISPRFWKLLGYDPSAHGDHPGAWREFLFKEDLPLVEDCLSKNGRISDEPINLTLRFRHQNGMTVWINSRGAAIKDDQDRPTRLVLAHTDITAIKEGETRLRILYNASFGGVAMHDQGRIIDCNQGLADITGYSLKELLGKEDGLALIAPEYRDFVMKKILAGDETPYETVGLRKNGELYPVQLVGRNIPYQGQQVRAVEFRDLTALKMEEKAKRQTEEQYRLLTSEMQLGLALHEIICDEDGHPIDYRFLNINRSFERLTGLRAETVVGKRILEVLPKTEPYWIDIYGQVALTGKSNQFENYSQELKKYYNVSVYSPKPGQFATIVEDITDKKLKEAEIIQASKFDFLTKLPNRRFFEERLEELDHPEHYPLLVAMIDFNGLKMINDAYGHQVGDEALIHVANQISQNIRPQDFAARIGGDEFIIICPKTTSFEFETIKQSILVGLASDCFIGFNVSVAFGHDIKHVSGEDIANVIINAENNMYGHKILHGQSARNEIIITLFNTLKEKNTTERIHSDRVSHYCQALGEKINLSPDEVKELTLAGLMHDIGKITIPDVILNKPGRLSEDQWVVMKKHTINGYQILRSADKYSRLAEYALTHHERWDGKGYPNGLSGEDIPLFSRIIHVCDAYEAMTSDRPYRQAMDPIQAVDELLRGAGTQFDQRLVEVFTKEVLNTP